MNLKVYDQLLIFVIIYIYNLFQSNYYISVEILNILESVSVSFLDDLMEIYYKTTLKYFIVFKVSISHKFSCINYLIIYLIPQDVIP